MVPPWPAEASVAHEKQLIPIFYIFLCAFLCPGLDVLIVVFLVVSFSFDARVFS